MTASLPPRNGHAPQGPSSNGSGTRHAAPDAPDPTEADIADSIRASRAGRLLSLTEPAPLKVRWGLVVIASLVIAGVLTAVLGGAPTYDPWAWIIWGREIIHGDLVTTAGPSWKPLPMLFTVPFAVFGDIAPDLWMWVARAVALVGIVAVADLAARLGGRLAAGLAAVAIALAPLYYAYGVQGSSEGALVLVCCLAATSWMDGRRSAAFWWLVAAALLRPEAWPFVAIVGLERLKDRPARIWWLAAAAALVVVAWLVPEKIGSGHFLRAATRAHDPNPESAAFAKSPTLDVLGSMGNLLLWVPAIGLVLTIIFGALAWRQPDERRVTPRPVLRAAAFLVGLSFAWVAIVAAMTEGGYAGNPRYLAAPLGLFIAVALGGIAWFVRVLARRRLASVAELLVMAALVLLVVVAGLRLPARTEEITYQSANRQQLQKMAEDPALKAQILGCGPITAHPLMVPPIAWSFHLHIDDVESLVPLNGGTYIVGTNAASRAVQPKVPAGLNLPVIARTSQITVVQDCTR